MPPEATATPDASQPIPESPSPATEAPAPATASETPPAPEEVAPEPETAQSPTQMAQMGRSEPLPPEPEPTDPEPPSAAASVPAPVIPQTGILHATREILVKARVAIQDRKRKKRDKITQALTTKSKITNDEVEKLLHVSDATATRYLSALEKENKIKQVGRTGTGVVYQKI